MAAPKGFPLTGRGGGLENEAGEDAAALFIESARGYRSWCLEEDL